jgi:hypothetical protein
MVELFFERFAITGNNKLMLLECNGNRITFGVRVYGIVMLFLAEDILIKVIK